MRRFKKSRWGERFLDVTAIFADRHSDQVMAKLNGSINLTKKPVMQMNSMKTFMGEAELKMGQVLRMPAAVTCGIPPALTLHDMKMQFVLLGIVDALANQDVFLPSEAKAAIVAKLLPILNVDLLPAAAPAQH